MTSFWDMMGGLGQGKRENFIVCAVNMIQGGGDFAILPIQDGIEGPADKPVIAIPDHLLDEFPVSGRFHGEKMFDRGGDLQEEGRYDPGGF